MYTYLYIHSLHTFASIQKISNSNFRSRTFNVCFKLKLFPTNWKKKSILFEINTFRKYEIVEKIQEIGKEIHFIWKKSKKGKIKERILRESFNSEKALL